MIVKVRIKDVDESEIPKCENPRRSAGISWSEIRGKEIEIITPGHYQRPADLSPNVKCEGPFYLLASRDFYVCPHFVDIGD